MLTNKLLFLLHSIGLDSSKSVIQILKFIKLKTDCKNIAENEVIDLLRDLQDLNLLYPLYLNKSTLNRKVWFLSKEGFDLTAAFFSKQFIDKKLIKKKIFKLSSAWQSVLIKKMTFEEKKAILKTTIEKASIASESLVILSQDFAQSDSLDLLKQVFESIIKKSIDPVLREAVCSCLFELEDLDFSIKLLLQIKENDFSKEVREKATYFYEKLKENKEKLSLLNNQTKEGENYRVIES